MFAAIDTVTDGLARDSMNYGLYYERFLLDGDSTFQTLLRDNVYTCIELALDYAHSGLWAEADALLDETGRSYPMIHYYQGWIRLDAGDETGADLAFRYGAAAQPDYCFPNELECVPALEAAMARNPADARAPYYLGCFWYAHRRYIEAVACWERARDLDPTYPTVHRNLSLAYMNKYHDAVAARASLTIAFELSPTDARVLFELDQLDKKSGKPPVERLGRLLDHHDLVESRDDLTLELVTLFNLLGRHAEALARLQTRIFHPWEGGEGKTTGQYVVALVELAKEALNTGRPADAVTCLHQAQAYPKTLGEGKLPLAQENHIHYYLGCAYTLLGDSGKARELFACAAAGPTDLAAATYYNDQPPDMVFYQALAHAALGHMERAVERCRQLTQYGEDHIYDEIQIDYFAVSLPDFQVFDDDLGLRHRIHCHYMAGLGYLGLEYLNISRNGRAAAAFAAVFALDAAHLGATLHKKMMRPAYLVISDRTGMTADSQGQSASVAGLR